MKAVFVVCFCLIFSLLLLYFPHRVFAVTVNVSNVPSTITSDNFTISVNVTGASTGTNYVRVDIFKDGTTNYFGETFNGQDWHADSDGTTYYPITIGEDKSGNATVEARIGNPTTHEYDGTGVYKVRARRYTSSGNPGSNDDMNAVQVAIMLDPPSNTPTSTVTPTKSPTPTHTPTPTKIPTPIHTPTPTKLQTNFQNSLASSAKLLITGKVTPTSSTATEEAVLSASTVSAVLISSTPTSLPSPTEEILIASDSTKGLPLWLIVPVGIGILFLSGGILLLWRKWSTRDV